MKELIFTNIKVLDLALVATTVALFLQTLVHSIQDMVIHKAQESLPIFVASVSWNG